MRKILVFLFFVTACCSKTPADQANSILFLQGKELAELTDKKMAESSGLAASANNPDLLWVHNDSGNDAEVFLIDEKLNIKLVCKLSGIQNRDWEDIAVGPGPQPDKSYIYIGEIGDNQAQYQYKNIYRFEEPEINEETEISVSKVDTITFQLPDQRKDTETLMIDPRTRDLYIISKREEPVYLYTLKYPYSTKDTLTAAKVCALPFTQITGGEISADGREILIKNYQNVYYWKIGGNESIAETMQRQPAVLPYIEEPQGEAITFNRKGSGFYTLSEKVEGEKSYLYFYKRSN